MAGRGRRWLGWAVLVAATAAIFSTACRRAPDGRVRSVLLISIDTCRADRLGCYGHAAGATPNLDRLAADGALFTAAISPAPITLPAHSSLLTGLVPPEHGVRDNINYRLSSEVTTLAEVIDASGLSTGAIVSSFVLDSRFGLGQGFDSYDDRFEAGHATAFGNERRAGEAAETAVHWLERHRAEPWFLFLHVYDPHWPYEPPEPWATSFADDPYSGEIAYVDHCLGEVLEALRRLELDDSTLVVIVGDHGELLGEHGETTHTYFIYQAAIQVPLIIRWPGARAGLRIDHPVGLVDIVPTVCASLGLSPPAEAGGIDLTPWVLGRETPEPERKLYCESLTPTRYGACALTGVVTRQWKYIDATQPELYDLQADRGETDNRFEELGEVAAGLSRDLRMITAGASSRDGSQRLELDQMSLDRLQALGYVGGSIDADLVSRQDLPDAKDLVGFHEDHQHAIDLLAQERWEEAGAISQRMVAQRPDFFEAHTNLARVALAQGELEEAVRLFRHTLELRPDQYSAHYSLGVALTRLERLDEASEEFRRALELAPNPLEARLNLATALMNQGRLDEARRELEEILRQAPSSPAIRAQLGSILSRQGEIEAAAEQWNEAVRLDPNGADSRLGLASALFELGRFDEAATHWRRAIELMPGRAEIANDAGARLARAGRVELAAGFFATAARAEPDSAEAHRNLAQALLSGKRPTEAEPHIRKLLELDPSDADAIAMLALTQAQRGDLEGAVQQLRIAVSLDPSSSAARQQLATLLVNIGRVEEAEQELRALLELEPAFTSARILLAQVLARQGRTAEAVTHLRTAVEHDPASAGAHYNLAMALLARGAEGALQEAAAGLRRVVILEPNMIEAHLNLAAAELRLGGERAAAEHYERALQLGSTSEGALDTLAWILATTSDQSLADPPRAVELARRACSATGFSRPELLDTLAVAYAANGDFRSATSTARDALNLASAGGRLDLAQALREHLAAFARREVPRDDEPLR